MNRRQFVGKSLKDTYFSEFKKMYITTIDVVMVDGEMSFYLIYVPFA